MHSQVRECLRLRNRHEFGQLRFPFWRYRKSDEQAPLPARHISFLHQRSFEGGYALGFLTLAKPVSFGFPPTIDCTLDASCGGRVKRARVRSLIFIRRTGDECQVHLDRGGRRRQDLQSHRS